MWEKSSKTLWFYFHTNSLILCTHYFSMLLSSRLLFMQSFMVALSQTVDNGHHKIQNHGQHKLFKNPAQNTGITSTLTLAGFSVQFGFLLDQQFGGFDALFVGSQSFVNSTSLLGMQIQRLVLQLKWKCQNNNSLKFK